MIAAPRFFEIGSKSEQLARLGAGRVSAFYSVGPRLHRIFQSWQMKTITDRGLYRLRWTDPRINDGSPGLLGGIFGDTAIGYPYRNDGTPPQLKSARGFTVKRRNAITDGSLFFKATDQTEGWWAITDVWFWTLLQTGINCIGCFSKRLMLGRLAGI